MPFILSEVKVIVWQKTQLILCRIKCSKERKNTGSAICVTFSVIFVLVKKISTYLTTYYMYIWALQRNLGALSNLCESRKRTFFPVVFSELCDVEDGTLGSGMNLNLLTWLASPQSTILFTIYNETLWCTEGY